MTVPFEQRLRLAGFETRALGLEGKGVPLILLHGYADSADTWRPLLDRLRRRGRAAVALDMPGFGAADRLDANRPVLEQLDEFAIAAIRKFAPDGGAFLAGNSLGGCVAMRAAERRELGIAGIAPIAPAGLDMAGWIAIVESERVIRLLLAAPVPLPTAIVRGAVGQAYRRLAVSHPRYAHRGVVSTFTSHITSRDAVVRLLATARRLRGELRDPFRLDRIPCPVLIIWGDRDRMVFASGADRVLATVPDSRMVMVPGCGHCPQIEDPDRVLELLEGFCATPLAAAA
jgi:pimeloyl-ACP methyl ester carboxylesterase